jgi:hypothetical protein
MIHYQKSLAEGMIGAVLSSLSLNYVHNLVNAL